MQIFPKFQDFFFFFDWTMTISYKFHIPVFICSRIMNKRKKEKNTGDFCYFGPQSMFRECSSIDFLKKEKEEGTQCQVLIAVITFLQFGTATWERSTRIILLYQKISIYKFPVSCIGLKTDCCEQLVNNKFMLRAIISTVHAYSTLRD